MKSQGRERNLHKYVINSAAAASLLLLGFLARGKFSLGAMAGLFVLLALGSALFQSPNNTEIMNALPRHQTAIASCVSAAGRNPLAHGIGNVIILSALVCAAAIPILASGRRTASGSAR